MASNIYTINYGSNAELTLPPRKRNTLILAFLAVLMKPIQWLHDLFFNTYADGFLGLPYAPGTYSKGDRVRYVDHCVYESIIDLNSLNPTQTSAWFKVQDNWIGVRERVKYSGVKIILEYALNKWFDTQFRQPKVEGYAAVADATHEKFSDIYILRNTLDSGGFIIGSTDAESSAIPKTEPYGDVGIGAVYSSIQNAFTIFIPLAVFNALSTDPISREPIVRGFADKYVIAGIIYDIQTY